MRPVARVGGYLLWVRRRLARRAGSEVVGLLLALFTSIVLHPAPGIGAEDSVDPFDLPPEQLFEATVISATKTDETWWSSPAAVYVLTNEDIARSGATSIPEALRLVPGVNVARMNASGWAISVRGFNSSIANKLLVLVDGREVYTTLYSGVYWDAQDTLLEDLERIEVIRGPGASLWGANAVNGVINIITKNARDTQDGLVSGLYGNEEGVAAARYGGAMSENGHYRIFSKFVHRDDQRAVGGGDGDDEWMAGRSGFRADWGRGSGRDSFMLQGEAYTIDDDRFRSIPQLTPPFGSVVEESADAHGAHLLGRWNRELAGDSRLSVQSYVDYAHRDFGVLEDDYYAFDLDAQYERQLGDWNRLLIGGRLRYTLDDLTGSPQASFRDARREYVTPSGFIQDKISFTDTVALTLGSKFEHNEYSGFEVQPSARLQWEPTARQMVWASVARAVRTPSRLENDVDLELAVIPPTPPVLPLPTLAVLQSNPDFDSEEVIAYELGYRMQWSERLLFDVAAFYNDYDRLRTITLGTSTLVDDGVNPPHFVLPIIATNDTQGETYGGEFIVSWRPLASLNLSAAYSYLDLSLDGPPPSVAINVEGPEGESPHHQFNVRSMWDVTDDLMVDTIVYYVDELPAFAVEDYWRLDLRVAWRVTEGLELSVVGQNLLDAAHREFSGPSDINATEIQRSVYGKVTWLF